MEAFLGHVAAGWKNAMNVQFIENSENFVYPSGNVVPSTINGKQTLAPTAK